MYISIPQEPDLFDPSATLSRCCVTASCRTDLPPLKNVWAVPSLLGNAIFSTKEATR